MRHIVPLVLAALAILACPIAAQAQRGGGPGTSDPQAAGQLIAADPVTETPPGMQAWRIRYWTRTEDNRPVESTGMVVAPREAGPVRPRNVIAWAHGTSGVAQACALSTRADFFTVAPALGDMIRAGYVVAASDYPGLGTPGPTALLAGQETARAVIDAVRAARAIPGAYAGSRFAVWGESQGGHAALWTAAEAGSYARELTLVATAAAAPPTDLPRNLAEASDPNVRALLMAFVSYSWSERYGVPMGSLFNPINRGVASRLARNNCVELDATPRLGTMLGVLAIKEAIRDTDIATVPVWGDLARRHSVNPRALHGPVLIAQSVADPVVAPQVTRDFAHRVCRTRGLRWIELPGGDHARSAADSATETLAWLADRFAGRRLVNDCRRIPS
ncbi:MAG: lipase family protein [Alteraurantiacibacter sp.]